MDAGAAVHERRAPDTPRCYEDEPSRVAMSVGIIANSLKALARRRPLFHSEADLQHALAWQLQLDHPQAQLRLETRPLHGKAVFLDLALMLDGQRVAVELKYLVRGLQVDLEGELFTLRHQSAHDVRRYDVVKDLCRLEDIVRAGAADVGVLVALTNDPAYWTSGRGGTIDAAFRLHEGQVLGGSVGWAAHAGAGTTDKRTEMLSLAGRYPLQWTDYSDVGGSAGRFRALIVEVADLDDGRSQGAAAPAPDVSTADVSTAHASPAEKHPMGPYATTCRSEILESFAALEQRHGREAFSPAEILAEVRARGGQHPDSTVRTHIVSSMCVNAPANHAVRYPDLERVGRGLYRRLQP